MPAAAFSNYGSRCYDYMEATVERVRAISNGPDGTPGSLRRPHDKQLGVFPCRTFNVEMQSVSLPHTDQGNLAQGWCSITPLGTFDHTSGGHLVLWDLGLIVQFPAGCTALIPSSIVCHSNVSIQPGELRHVIVQYSSGRLFRWVHNGLMTDKAWLELATPEERDQRKYVEQKRRWREAVDMFLTLDELKTGLKA
jgi:hypothetical protein